MPVRVHLHAGARVYGRAALHIRCLRTACAPQVLVALLSNLCSFLVVVARSFLPVLGNLVVTPGALVGSGRELAQPHHCIKCERAQARTRHE